MRESLQAFVFPGTGVQEEGMARNLFFHRDSETSLITQRTYEEADDTLGIRLKYLSIVRGTKAELNKSSITQPAILTASVAAFRILRHRGIKPDVVAGHSLGEYSALVAAEALSFEQALRLVRARGQFMEEAARQNPGGMVAVLGLNLRRVKEICRRFRAYPANINGLEHIVVSGGNDSISQIAAYVNSIGKRAIPLDVAVPAHSPFMEPARQEMERLLADEPISDLSFPLIMNTNARYALNPEQIREELINQLPGGVLWFDAVEQMRRDGVGSYIEVGPGKVLSGLIKRIDPNATINSSEVMLGAVPSKSLR